MNGIPRGLIKEVKTVLHVGTVVMEESKEQQIATFLRMVEEQLRSSMSAGSSAEMKFAVQLTGGGIRDKWVETKVKAR